MVGIVAVNNLVVLIFSLFQLALPDIAKKETFSSCHLSHSNRSP